MADNKLSWTELRKIVASRTGATEKEARLFLEALNEQIVAALKEDKIVRINGIGTFRLQTVSPRKSVNVHTGEAITIEGYDKIAFTPESSIKELIEHNTSMKKTNTKQAEEINPLQKLGEQADEIVDILNDLGQTPNEGPKKAKKAPKKATKKAVKETVAEPVVAEEAKVAEPEPTPVAEVPAAAPIAPEEEKEKSHFLRDTLICVVILLMLLLGGYFFLRHQIGAWLDGLKNPQPVQTEQVVAEEQSEPAEAIVIPEEIVYDKLITTEKMHKHSRLAWMAWRYYGNKAFWVYLYDANKDHIVNPDKIVTGTPIRVPQLTEEQMDTTLESTRLILQRLTEQGEAAKLR